MIASGGTCLREVHAERVLAGGAAAFAGRRPTCRRGSRSRRCRSGRSCWSSARPSAAARCGPCGCAHGAAPSQDVGLAAVDQAVDADGDDGPSLPRRSRAARAAGPRWPGRRSSGRCLGVEHREVAAALEGLGLGVVGDRAAHVRAQRAVGDDVAVRADAARDLDAPS